MSPHTTKYSFWSWPWRAVVFSLAATSIACLLADLYQLCSMRFFSWTVFLPALILLIFIATADYLKGNRLLYRRIWIGSWVGFFATIAYDLFRLPFVYSQTWGIENWMPYLPLFKVFPRFGAMILGEPTEQIAYSWLCHGVGWIYHFSNGITFGIMYTTLLDPKKDRYWYAGILMALVVEGGLLLSPYTKELGIRLTITFIWVTLAAHIIFGFVLGMGTWIWSKSPLK